MTQFSFRQELFEEKARAQEVLSNASFNWFEDYQSVDLLHEEYGLEVCGIRDEETALGIKEVMERTFVKWWNSAYYYKDYGADVGWKVIIQQKPFSGPMDSVF
jgi:hypothetical protein